MTKSLELSPLQNAILVRIGTAERMETNRLINLVIGKRTILNAEDRRDLEQEILMHLHLFEIYGLVGVATRPNGREIRIASERVREWLPDHIRRAQSDGTMHRPSIALPFVAAAAIAATGCAGFGAMTSQEPAPVVARYEANPSIKHERMAQFKDSRGNLVYRYCVGNECPEPTPKRPAMRSLPTVAEVTEDGTILPSEPPPSIPFRKDVAAPVKAPSAAPPGIPSRVKAPPPPTAPLVSADKAPRAPAQAATPATQTPPQAPPATPATPEAISGSPKTETPRPDPRTPLSGTPRPSPVAATPPPIHVGGVAGLVAEWANLWSARDKDAYFALYDETFKPSTGQRAKDWMLARGGIMQRANRINVSIENLSIVEKDGSATATFAQNYESPRFKSRILKRLDLVLADGQWRIKREMVLTPVERA